MNRLFTLNLALLFCALFAESAEVQAADLSQKTSYVNGSRMTAHYRADGTLFDLEEWNKQGELIKHAVYQRDGISKISESIYTYSVLPNGDLNMMRHLTVYDDDGKHVKFTAKEDPAGETEILHFNEKGVLLLKRVLNKGSTSVDITIHDSNGKELYCQHQRVAHLDGIRYLALESVTETSTSGIKRRIITNDPGPKANKSISVEKVEYLKTDGSVEKTEKSDALSEPVDEKLLRKLEQI
ncbi:MAG: hypothetical protein K2W82_16145 [Candidatus Obscuribacterales bacterium]|nr:hypothetical protein [Candidatus Obscuribacterales bacterium]